VGLVLGVEKVGGPFAMAGAACISSSHHAIAGAVACSGRAQQQQQGGHQLAMPSCSFSGDSVSSFLHAGICSPLRTRAVAQRRRVVKPRVVESVLAEIAEENVVCMWSPHSIE
jgi:hypothetical protein